MKLVESIVAELRDTGRISSAQAVQAAGAYLDAAAAQPQRRRISKHRDLGVPMDGDFNHWSAIGLKRIEHLRQGNLSSESLDAAAAGRATTDAAEAAATEPVTDI